MIAAIERAIALKSTYNIKIINLSLGRPIMESYLDDPLLEKQPYLTPDQIKAKPMKTASKTFPAFTLAPDPVRRTIYTVQYDLFTVGADTSTYGRP